MLYLPISDGAGHYLRDAHVRTIAHLYYPTSEEQRRNLIALITNPNPLRFGRVDLIEPEEARIAHIRSVLNRIFVAVERDGEGNGVAGELLLMVCNIASYSPRQGSLRRARQIFAKDQVKIAHSERSLKKAWANFKSVAPMAAALRLHLANHAHRDDRFDPLNLETLPNFLAMSEALWIWATSYHPPLGRTGSKRSPRTLLDPEETWRQPPDLTLPSAWLRVPDFTDYLTTQLKLYSRRQPSIQKHQ